MIKAEVLGQGGENTCPCPTIRTVARTRRRQLFHAFANPVPVLSSWALGPREAGPPPATPHPYTPPKTPSHPGPEPDQGGGEDQSNE